MDLKHSDSHSPSLPAPVAIKILVSGGFGAGKTTLVGAVSEIHPLHTEEFLTAESENVDDLAGVERKETTTVAMDFGRITIRDRLIVYLFGTPGQRRFWFMWDELAYGAIGAVVLADTRRLSDSFACVDYFEQRNIPFLVAVNCFDGTEAHTLSEIRQALALDASVPIMLCDAREKGSAKEVLITLVSHVMDVAQKRGAPASVS